MSGGGTDLLVVGGGPAGLATAIRARLAGLDTVVLDRSHPPIDKACGEGLMPDAVARLREIGVEPRGFPFRGIRYFDGDVVAEGIFPHAGGLGVRRTELHGALVCRAAEVGVDLRWGVKAEGLGPEGVQTGQGTFAARWIAGADGLRSPVRRWAGLEAGEGRFRRFGVRRHLAMAPWSDFVEVYWGPACEAYVTPVSDDQVGIAMLWSGGKAGFDALLERIPTLRARVAGATVASKDRGAGPLHQRARAVRSGNVALVGDAAGYLDAITGEGLAVALHESAALVDAIVAGDLGRYAAAHRRVNRLPNTMTSVVLALERRPRLRARAVRALAAEPALFSRLLGIHARTLPPRRLGVEGALRLAWRLVAA
ncbi:MAG TPA: NAD(P)/FAD-dependent oxidoreductase [Thermoanaerobaculia bacterium]|jgi:flavin-dependent dehydrogenase|nr:NAD(P)/FAD-dependent oxidoreductase [Thermoanaerobaculia bacterium]